MDAFETSLKRAFAEIPEPEDTGFTVAVTHKVEKRERAAIWGQLTHRVGLAAAGAAVAYGAAQLVQVAGPQLMATIGLELARANGALSQSSFSLSVVGLTQLLVVAAAVAGGAVAYRTVRE